MMQQKLFFMVSKKQDKKARLGGLFFALDKNRDNMYNIKRLHI
jgi:hypothetical protein